MFLYFIKALAYFSALTLRFREIENKNFSSLSPAKVSGKRGDPGTSLSFVARGRSSHFFRSTAGALRRIMKLGISRKEAAFLMASL